MKVKVIGMLAACLGLSWVQTQAQAAEDLFLPQQQPASAISAAPRQFPQSALSEDTPVRSALHGLRVNPLAFKDKQLSFRLPDGVLIEADLVHQYATKNGATVWIVKHRMNPNQAAMAGDNESVLVIRNAHITGNVRHQLKLYQIRANAVGEHSVGEIALEKMPPDHSESSYLNTPVGPRLGAGASHPWNKFSSVKWKRTGELAEYDERHLQDLAVSKRDAQLTTAKSALMPAPTEAPVIRLMVHYTAAAKAGAGTAENAIEDLINLSVAETNRSFQNSTINARVELATSALVNYVESDDADTDKQRYVGKNDGFMDEVHAQRDQYAADVGVLILEKLGGVCGSAAKIGADAASAFVVVKRSCSAGSLSFPHEIGHLFGARHNIEKDANVTIPYAHGYQNPEFKWRTIMAYDCTTNCPRLPYWSNPRVIYSDGAAMGLAASADNARVLNEQAAVMAAFRPPLVEKNLAPVVDAGLNLQIVLPATAALNGNASDDGLPQGSSLSYAWSQVSGPGVVTVSDAKALKTNASFSSPGTYVLRLTASDGSLQTSDDMTVTAIAN